MLLVHRDVGLRALASPNWSASWSIRRLILFSPTPSTIWRSPALPLADAVALFFMAPLFIMAMAGPYLGERVSWQTLATVLVGLVGVVVMLRPGAGLFEWAALLSLGSAALYGFSQLMARKIGDTGIVPPS